MLNVQSYLLCTFQDTFAKPPQTPEMPSCHLHEGASKPSFSLKKIERKILLSFLTQRKTIAHESERVVGVVINFEVFAADVL